MGGGLKTDLEESLKTVPPFGCILLACMIQNTWWGWGYQLCRGKDYISFTNRVKNQAKVIFNRLKGHIQINTWGILAMFFHKTQSNTV